MCKAKHTAAATAAVRLFHLDEVDVRYPPEQLAWGLGDRLATAEMAGIVVGDGDGITVRSLAPDQPVLREELTYVVDPDSEWVFLETEYLLVVTLECDPARGTGNNNSIELVRLEGVNVRMGELPPCVPVTRRVNRHTAAPLPPGQHHLYSLAHEYPQDRPAYISVNQIGRTPDEEAHPHSRLP